MRLFLTFLFLLSGCAHKELRPPLGGGIFPFGTYQHNVKITTPDRTMEMCGVVSYREGQLKVIGLTAFGATAFRIEEAHGVIKKEFYLDIIKKHEDRFMYFYQMIRELITAPKGLSDFTRQGAHFVFSGPDANGIYKNIHITHPQFTLDIEVTDYEF